MGGCAKQHIHQFNPPSGELSSGQPGSGARLAQPSASTKDVVVTKKMREVRELSKRGTAALKAGNFSAAEEVFEELIHREPNNPFRYRWLAMAYEGQGRTRDAYAAWTKVLTGTLKGRSTDQSDPYILARYGELCLQVGDRASAEIAFGMASREVRKLFNSSIERVPKGRISQQMSRALAHYNAGVEMSLGGQHKKAEDELRQAVKFAPHWPLAKIGLATELCQEGRRDEAEQLFEGVRTSGAGEASKFAATKMRDFGLDRNMVTVIHNRGDGTTYDVRMTKEQFERTKDGKSVQTNH
ncbi:hypothetical protein BH09PAT4_BH09PAT4_09040 [soil metagenome]